MPSKMTDLLETCFEDKPDYRPSNAGELAEKLRPGTEEVPPGPGEYWVVFSKRLEYRNLSRQTGLDSA